MTTSRQRVVVCAGDSITQGTMSADYVRLLEERHVTTGTRFVNAGVNGDLAVNLLRRLDVVIAAEPDVVTVLIGTNDVNAASASPRELSYLRRAKQIDRKPTLEWYVENVDAVLGRLRRETTARVAVLDLPMLGEDLTSPVNERVQAYSAALRDVAGRHDVPVLGLHERLSALLPPGHRAPEFRQGNVRPMIAAGLSHAVLRRSWNRIAERAGLAVTTDHIHLNDTAAEVVAEVISEFLEGAAG